MKDLYELRAECWIATMAAALSADKTLSVKLAAEIADAAVFYFDKRWDAEIGEILEARSRSGRV